MKINAGNEAKLWAVFLLVALLSFFVHELGHCTVAWLYGIKAVPTPAKEYLLSTNISPDAEKDIALGGIAGTVLFTLFGMWYFITGRTNLKAAVLAGAITTPGVYMLMFILKGRGHDDVEFQNAQSALGLAYTGHFIDWVSVVLFAVATGLWLWIAKPSPRVIPRLVAGVFIAFIFTGIVQKVNNMVFDPIFSSH